MHFRPLCRAVSASAAAMPMRRRPPGAPIQTLQEGSRSLVVSDRKTDAPRGPDGRAGPLSMLRSYEEVVP